MAGFGFQRVNGLAFVDPQSVPFNPLPPPW